MQETVRYNYRLRPGAKAESALIAEWHRTRFLWNDAVEQVKSGNRTTFALLCKRLTSLRGSNEWLRSGSTVTQQQELKNFTAAMSHSRKLAGRGAPRFKSAKKSRPSLNYTAGRFSFKEGALVLSGGIKSPVVWSRALPSEPSSARVYRDNLGHWYVSFVVGREIESAPEVDGSIGIDWGVKKTATTTSPAYDLEHLGLRRRSAAELARAQRKMSRRHKPKGQAQSKGYKRAKTEAAKVSKKAQRRNTHEGRIWAKRLVDAHQLIAVEDFKSRFLAKSTMARKASDNGVSTVKRTLIEYAERAGRKVVLVNPAYTTMTCSGCFARAKRLKLDERIFSCKSCGFTADRDENAARTILAVAERGHTSVEDIRRLTTPVKSSIAV